MANSEVSQQATHSRIVAASGSLVVFAGAGALAAWWSGSPFVAAFGPDWMPMAPSTAVLFVLFGAALALQARRTAGRTSLWAGIVANVAGVVVALPLVILSARGTLLSIERLGLPGEGTVAGVPIGHMSPVTATCFLMAGLAFLGWAASGNGRRWPSVASWWLTSFVLVVAVAFLLAYVYGAPFLYGAGIVPPAIPTLLAFAVLGIGLAALIPSRAWPVDATDRLPISPAPLLVVLFLLLAAGFTTAGYLYVRGFSRQYRAQVEATLESVAELKVSELVNYRRERLGDAEIFFDNPALSGLVEQLLEGGADGEARRYLQAWLGRVQSHFHYEGISISTPEGEEAFAVPAQSSPSSERVRGRVAEALRRDAVELVDFHRNEHDGRIYLTVVVPILTAESPKRPLGALLMRIDPESYLFPLLANWPVPTETAETYLVRRDGDKVVYLSNVRYRAGTALEFEVSLEQQESAAVQAALGHEGIVDAVDYRGQPVIAAVHAVPDSPWHMIARIDREEVAAPLRRQMWLAILLVGALIAAAGAGIGGVWRQQRTRYYRERYQVERERAWMSEVISRSLNEIWVFDPESLRFSFVNRGARLNIGYEAEELARMTPLDVKPEFDEASFRAAIEPLRRGERDLLHLETVHRRKDGSEYPVDVTLQYVGAAERPVFLAVINDITERRRMEEALRQAQKMEAVGRLAGGVAHDFNNQLFVINGYCDMLLSDPSLPPSVAEEIREIRKAAGHSASLTAQLLAFSRKQLLQPRVLDINAELRGMEPMLGRLAGEQVQLAIVTDGGVSHVKFDPNQLRQVVVNLALNARDAMPDGGRLTIETRAAVLDADYVREHVDVQPGHYVQLSVSDTGQGMDAETASRIFEPFFTTKEVGRGTGLGLATVHGIVKQSGGHIAVYSEVGHGTSVRVYFPPSAEAVEIEEGAEPAEPTGGRETILVAEDDPAVRTLVVRVLAERGYRVYAAASGREALEVAQATADGIDLLLTDVVMPEMSGTRLATEMASLHPETRVLYMSGYAEDAVVQHGVLGEGDAFLPKPCAADLLLRRVREVLDSGGSARPRSRRVLVVDDVENERLLVRRLLSKAGYDVLEAAGGAEALATLEREAVDLVLCDVNMPGMSGFELVEAVRRSPRFGATPVVLLSGAYRDDEVERARRAGVVACLDKGATESRELLDVLAEILGERRGASGGGHAAAGNSGE